MPTPPPYPADATPQELSRLALDLGVPPLPADTFRARVCAAFADDATIDRAVPATTPPTGTPMVLGGMTLGAAPASKE